jgi:hypothetical protein
VTGRRHPPREPCPASSVTALRVLSPLRAGIGVARLAYPHTVIPGLAAGSLSSRGRKVVRVLGARQVAQAVVTGRAPTPAVLWLGTEVDVAHAATMIGLAVVERRYRRAALVDGAIAMAFALVGAAAARSAPSKPAVTSRLAGWRNRRAEQAARHLVPGYRPGRLPTQ